MFERFKNYLSYSNISNSQDKRLVVNVLSFTLVAVCLLALADINRAEMLFLGACILLSLLLVYWGFSISVGTLLPLMGFFLIIYLIFAHLGLRDTAMLGLPVVIVAASLLNGRRGAIVFGILSIVMVLILWLAESNGWVDHPLRGYDRPADYITVLILIVLIMSLQWAVIQRLDATIAETRNELIERQRAEKALTASEARYSAVVNQAYDGVVIIQDEQIVFANYRMASMLGYGKASEMINIDYLKHIAPHEKEKVAAISKARLSGLTAPRIYETQLIHIDGSLFDVEISAGLIEFDGKRASISVIRDITERKKAQDILRQTEEKFTQVFQTSPEPIAISEVADGKIVDANPAFAAAFGYEIQELIGRTVFELNMYFHKSDRYELVRRLKQKGEVYGMEVTLRRRDGSLFVASASSRLITINQVPCMIYTARDITERKAFEDKIARLNLELERRVQERTSQLEIANRELESFAYSVSHDLRSPLRAINGFSRILAEDYYEKLGQDGRQWLEKIQASSNRMDELINALLAFSRLSRQPIHAVRVEPAAMVEQIISELRATVDHHRQVDWQVGTLPACDADPALLRQVYSNLLDNALKYTRGREIARIEVGSFEKEGYVVYFVSDNGAGFDMKYAGKLFGVFQRLHSDSEFEGTGVGLANVQRIILRHGGRIWAEAARDKGATFFFTIGASGSPGEKNL